MSAYANDRRVRPHPDGTWMVFDLDNDTTEYNVRETQAGTWDATDTKGHLIPEASGKASMDEAIEALIGPAR